MPSTLKEFKARALARPEVKEACDALADEFALIDEFLKARAAAGLTPAEVAARLESPAHSPSVATLRKYARAIGCRLEIRLVKESGKRWSCRFRLSGSA